MSIVLCYYIDMATHVLFCDLLRVSPRHLRVLPKYTDGLHLRYKLINFTLIISKETGSSVDQAMASGKYAMDGRSSNVDRVNYFYFMRLLICNNRKF